MSEVQSRPAASRGRGSGRGGRGGGFATRGGSRAVTRNSATNGDTKHDTDSSLPTLEDEGEIGQLKQKYGSKVAVIKEMFEDWSDVDILFALRETDGDENLTVTRMAEGKYNFHLRSLVPDAPFPHVIVGNPTPGTGGWAVLWNPTQVKEALRLTCDRNHLTVG